MRPLFTPKGELLASLLAGALLLIGWPLMRLLAEHGGAGIGSALVWASLAIGLLYGGRAAYEALKSATFDIDVLMVVGAVLAAWIGHPEEGALLLFLFVLSGSLEDLAMKRTTRAVEALSRLIPTTAVRLDPATGLYAPVPPETLLPGDRVKIAPGELIPADATVSATGEAEGTTSIDQSTLTGESMPRDVGDGDEIYAGTLNVGNPIEAVITRPARESSLQRIVDLVTTAQQQREPVQRLIDRVSQPYAIGVLLLSVAVFLVWWLALGRAATESVTTAITLLIVASPCALIISTPTATLAAISRAARGGVLFKGGQAIERLARVRAVAFDKTGTLTIGKPRVEQVHAVAWSDGARLIAVAAALEGSSTHPIAAAVLEVARARAIAPATVESLSYVAGRGVTGIIDGAEARLGSLAHTETLIPACLRGRVREVLMRVQERGQIGVVCADGENAGVLILSDAVRPGAECLVERLHALGVRPLVMLTGDNELTAAKVAERLGLDEFHAGLLPEEKVRHVERLKGAPEGRGRVAVGIIGDGVNDAPALAAADAAIAIGSIGSDAALEAADIVLLSDDLSAVPWAVRLARRCRRTITINLAFALGAIAVLAVAVLIGSLIGRPIPLWMGVLGHEGGTLLVVAHSLLVLGYPGVPLCGRSSRAGAGGAKDSATALTVEGRAVAAVS